jgi:hypothetical protein
VAGAVGVLFAALEALNGEDTAVVVAGLGVVAVAILAAAISTSVDVLARAWVTASEQKAVPPNEEESEAGEEPTEAPYVTAATPGMKLDTENHGSGLLVFAIGRDPEDEEPRYLAAKPGKRPRWISHDEVASVSYGVNGGRSGVPHADEADHVRARDAKSEQKASEGQSASTE